MEYFIETVDTIVEGVGFSYYGPLHIMWISIFIGFAIFMSIIYRKSDAKKRDKLRKIMAAAIVADEIWMMFWLILV